MTSQSLMSVAQARRFAHHARMAEDGYQKAVAAYIRAVREATGWSQKRLAVAVGVSQSSIARAENAEYEHKSKLTWLARLPAETGVPLPAEIAPQVNDGLADRGRAFERGEPISDPGPLDHAAAVRALRAVLGALMQDDSLPGVSEARLSLAAHSASDAWRALARQGLTLDSAFSPTLSAFFLRGRGPDRDDIQRAAEITADVYRALEPLSSIGNST